MLPLILSASLITASGDFSLFGKGKCEEAQQVQKKYYLTNLVGIVFFFGGIVAVQNGSKLGGGFAMGIGAPFAALGAAGLLEVYEW